MQVVFLNYNIVWLRITDEISVLEMRRILMWLGLIYLFSCLVDISFI